MQTTDIHKQLESRMQLAELCGLTPEEARISAINWINREYNVNLFKELEIKEPEDRFIKAGEMAERLGLDGEGPYKAYKFNLMCWAAGYIRPNTGKEGWEPTKKGLQSRLVKTASAGYMVNFLPEILTEVSKIKDFNFEQARAMHRAVMEA